MNSTTEKPPLESKMAVQILHELEKKGQSYTSEIARSLNKSQPTVNEVIQKLHRSQFIRVEKQSQAKYFGIDYDYIVDYWFSNLVEDSDSISQRNKVVLDIIENDDRFESLSADKIGQNVQKGLQDNEIMIKKFIKKYLSSILDAKPGETTIKEILNTGLHIDLIEYKFDKPNHFPTYLNPLKNALDRKISVYRLSYEIEDIVDEIEKNSG